MQVESSYVEALEGMFPALLTILFFAVFGMVFRMVFGVNSIQEWFSNIASWSLEVIDNDFISGLCILLVIHLLWFLGIHGNNVLDAFIQENYIHLDTSIYNKTFQDVFVVIGGCGAALCLVIAVLLYAKKRNVRHIAKVALPSAIFNISEIIVFGLPVILNSIFLLPFILVPVVNYLISYGAVYIGLIPRVTCEVEWTTPIFLSGYQATGSWTGAAIQLFCLAIGVCIYLPFVYLYEKMADKQLAADVQKLTEEFKREEEATNITKLTEREDDYGKTARYLAADLEDAINNREMFLLYQPQVKGDEVCIGAETLVRWKHSIAGFIYPPLIVQLAKEKNLLHNLEELILDEAVGAAAVIQRKISSEFKISINITNHSLEWDGFEECLDRCAKKHGIAYEKIWLEITEQDALSSSNAIMDKLQRMKAKGYKLLIDDFGMGHTSLLYLQTNYFDVVKLDGSLTRDVLENERDRGIIDSIVHLGKSLNFTTIAEYVETKEQKDKLQSLGCDVFQGYLYSKPIALEELITWMKQQNGR